MLSYCESALVLGVATLTLALHVSSQLSRHVFDRFSSLTHANEGVTAGGKETNKLRMISWPSSGIDDGYMWLALVGKSVGGEGVEGGGGRKTEKAYRIYVCQVHT